MRTSLDRKHPVPKRRRDDDSGVTLILALIIITVFALIATAAASFAFTNFRRSESTYNRIRRVTTADAGMRHLLSQLSESPEICFGVAPVQPPAVNGYAAQISCTPQGGVNQGRVVWALVLTDPAAASYSQASGSAGKFIKGPVLIPNLPADLGGPNQTLTVEGNVYSSAGWCRTDNTFSPPPWLRFKSGSYLYPVGTGPLFCGRQYTYDAQFASKPTLPDWSIVQTPPPAPVEYTIPATGGTCAVYSPGVYRNETQFPPAQYAEVYFKSGVYYFENVTLNIANNTFIKAGNPFGATIAVPNSAGETRVPDCAIFANETPASDGYGATFIFGGTSRIVVPGSPYGSLEIFRRLPPAGSTAEIGNEFVSLMTVPPTAGAPWQPSSLNAAGQCNENAAPADSAIIIADNGQNTLFGSNGLIHVPNAQVCIFATGSSVFNISGGMVAANVDVDASNSGTGLVISGGGSERPSQLVLTSTTTGRGIGREITARAVVDVGTAADGTRTLGIQSWVVQ